ncbi:hypothetical protein IWW50_001568 [Coemansia erecta]|nr:hypothetical protein IWW50_001568 [Coemansia erecta]
MLPVDTFAITFEGKEGQFTVTCNMWDLHEKQLHDIFPSKISKHYQQLLFSSVAEGDKEVYGLERILLEIYNASYEKTKVRVIYGEEVKVVIFKEGVGAKGRFHYSNFHDVGKILRDHSVVYHSCGVTVNEKSCCKKYLRDRLYEICPGNLDILIRVSSPVII